MSHSTWPPAGEQREHPAGGELPDAATRAEEGVGLPRGDGERRQGDAERERSNHDAEHHAQTQLSLRVRLRGLSWPSGLGASSGDRGDEQHGGEQQEGRGHVELLLDAERPEVLPGRDGLTSLQVVGLLREERPVAEGHGGASLRMRRAQKSARSSRPVEMSRCPRCPRIRYPETTKNTSTPMYPPGMRAGQAWYRMTATTAKARRAWISGRQRRARCAGASTVSGVDAGAAMVLSRIRPRGPAASR